MAAGAREGPCRSALLESVLAERRELHEEVEPVEDAGGDALGEPWEHAFAEARARLGRKRRCCNVPCRTAAAVATEPRTNGQPMWPAPAMDAHARRYPAAVSSPLRRRRG